MMTQFKRYGLYQRVLYVGMAWKKNGRPYISIASGKLKSLVIYTNKLKYT